MYTSDNDYFDLANSVIVGLSVILVAFIPILLISTYQLTGFFWLIPITCLLLYLVDNIVTIIIDIEDAELANYKMQRSRQNKKFIQLVNRYVEKKKKDLIKKEAEIRTNKLIEIAAYKYKHHKSMKSIVKEVKMEKLYLNFFNNIKTVILDNQIIDKEYLENLISFFIKKDIKLVIIGLSNPIEIIDGFDSKYFNLNNVITPYHFKKAYWSGIYKIDNAEIKNNLKNKLVCNKDDLINYINNTYNLVSNEVIYFSDKVSDKVADLNILSFKIDSLSYDNFTNLANSWLETVKE